MHPHSCRRRCCRFLALGCGRQGRGQQRRLLHALRLFVRQGRQRWQRQPGVCASLQPQCQRALQVCCAGITRPIGKQGQPALIVMRSPGVCRMYHDHLLQSAESSTPPPPVNLVRSDTHSQRVNFAFLKFGKVGAEPSLVGPFAKRLVSRMSSAGCVYIRTGGRHVDAVDSGQVSETASIQQERRPGTWRQGYKVPVQVGWRLCGVELDHRQRHSLPRAPVV